MRILVVEDEEKIAKSIKRALEMEHYAVDIESDGDEAFAMASTEPYDCIILDRMIPGSIDGLGVLIELRKANIKTPVLFLTALGTTEDIMDGLDEGGDDYMVKPFSIDELLARVRALIRRPKELNEVVLRIGKLELNPNNSKVSYNGKNISLTSKEYATLEYLMRNPDRPLSKENIISHVWSFDDDILPNTVEVYIKYLREKIDKRFNVDIIKTIRGFGYQIDSK
jgi:two component transcriptional regulator, winged helix family protein